VPAFFIGIEPSYPENETPAPVKGYTYEKVKITSTGGYDSFNRQLIGMYHPLT
jgi:hypothetical protein